MASGSVLITGTSSGIGLAAAKHLAEKGFRVFGTVRKQADAERIKGKYGAGEIVPVLMDVTDDASIERAAPVVASLVRRPRAPPSAVTWPAAAS